jgi:hypothetical protein
MSKDSQDSLPTTFTSLICVILTVPMLLFLCYLLVKAVTWSLGMFMDGANPYTSF